MESALKLAEIADRLHYSNRKVVSKDMWYYAWKEIHFYALGGLQSFDITDLPNTSFMKALLNHEQHSSGIICGISQVFFQKGSKISPEETVVSHLSSLLVDWAMHGKDMKTYPHLLRKALKTFQKNHPDLPGVTELTEKARRHLDDYIEYKYGDGVEPLTIPPYNVKVIMMINPVFRTQFYHDQKWGVTNPIEGLRSIIVALDVLIDVQDNFENLLRFVVLSDRRDPHAVILSSILYALHHGMDQVPSRWWRH